MAFLPLNTHLNDSFHDEDSTLRLYHDDAGRLFKAQGGSLEIAHLTSDGGL